MKDEDAKGRGRIWSQSMGLPLRSSRRDYREKLSKNW
jgi:hypothetical protein